MSRTTRLREHGRRGLRHAGAVLRRYFITGILVLAPLVITFWVIYNVFYALDTRFARLFAAYEQYIPGLGFIAGIAFILLIGAIASNYIGRRFITWGEAIVARIPVVSRIYRAAKQVGDAVLGQNRALFQKVVLLEYPRRGMYSLAFMTNEQAAEIQEKTGPSVVAVFLPTTPNPTSGYLLYVPREDAIILDMSVEEAMKLIISAGAFLPSMAPEGEAASPLGGQVLGAPAPPPAMERS